MHEEESRFNFQRLIKTARIEGLADDTCSSVFRFIRWFRENIRVDNKSPPVFRGQELVQEIEEMCSNCHLDTELFVKAFLENLSHLADFTAGFSLEIFHILHYAPSDNIRKLSLSDISNIARAGHSYLIQNIIFKWYILRQNPDPDFEPFSVRKISKWDFNEICMRYLDTTSLETLLKNRHDVMYTEDLQKLLLNKLQQSDKLFLLNLKNIPSFDKIVKSIQTHDKRGLSDVVKGSCKIVGRKDYTELASKSMAKIHDELLLLEKIVQINKGESPDMMNLTQWQTELFSQVLQPYFCNTAPPAILEKYRSFVDCKNFHEDFCNRPTFTYFAMNKWMTGLQPVLKEMHALHLDIRSSYCDLCYNDYKRLEKVSKDDLRFFVAYDLLDKLVVYRANFADRCDIGLKKGHLFTLSQKIQEMQDLLNNMMKSLVSDAQELERFLIGKKKFVKRQTCNVSLEN